MAPETLVAPAVHAGRVVVLEPRRWLDVPLYWQHAATRASHRAHYRLRTSLPLGRHGRDRPTYKDAPRKGRAGADAGNLPAPHCAGTVHHRRTGFGLGTGTAAPGTGLRCAGRRRRGRAQQAGPAGRHPPAAPAGDHRRSTPPAVPEDPHPAAGLAGAGGRSLRHRLAAVVHRTRLAHPPGSDRGTAAVHRWGDPCCTARRQRRP
ncbi:hypothetical protein G6F40_013827 [Rhizopus arrhizus]|nr:hypothetical protein G6F40_013827 [Rhizopus arrhizus]